MLALRILDVKKCMHHMLAADTFDFLQLSDAKIVTKAVMTLDGHVAPGLFSADEEEALGMDAQRCLPYKELRPVCFSFIRGKRKPSFFHFTFLYPRAALTAMLAEEQLLEKQWQGAALALNMKYERDELLVTTGCSLQEFSLDRTLEQLWDACVLSFFKKMGVALEKVI